jgi:hypothetical protein
MGHFYYGHRHLFWHSLPCCLHNTMQPSLPAMGPCSGGFLQTSELGRVQLHLSESSYRHSNCYSAYALAVEVTDAIKQQTRGDAHVQFRYCVSYSL